MFEIDLHGYTVVEAIRMFVDSYNRRVEKGDTSSIGVIHGYGSTGGGGKIRTAFLKILSAHEDCLTFSTDPVNPGRTTVRPLCKLPAGSGIISSEILEFCSTGKAESKILGKFRRYGDLNVKNTLRLLLKQGRLTCSIRGKHRIYSS